MLGVHIIISDQIMAFAKLVLWGLEMELKFSLLNVVMTIILIALEDLSTGVAMLVHIAKLQLDKDEHSQELKFD